jgi:hypothetical protein
MFKLKTIYLILLSSIILCLNLSCNKTAQSEEKVLQNVNSKNINSKEFKVSAKDINQIKYTEFALSDLSEKSTEDWLKFQELQEGIMLLKKGDLSFFKDDKAILKSLFTDLKNEIPETLNTPPILVRLSVLETTIFKLEGTSNINNVKKELLLNAIKEVLTAYSNIILQMNKKLEKDSQNIEKPS